MKKSILVVPVGEIDIQVIEVLKEGLGSIFDREVAVGAALDEPVYALNMKRDQYSADAILARLNTLRESGSHERTLGVVNHDLYVPELNFVFGVASGSHALISLARLRRKPDGRPEDNEIFEKRLITEAAHELGHTYRLGHCRDQRCVMFFSNSLGDTDSKGYEFCKLCKRGIL